MASKPLRSRKRRIEASSAAVQGWAETSTVEVRRLRYATSWRRASVTPLRPIAASSVDQARSDSAGGAVDRRLVGPGGEGQRRVQPGARVEDEGPSVGSQQVGEAARHRGCQLTRGGACRIQGRGRGRAVAVEVEAHLHRQRTAVVQAQAGEAVYALALADLQPRPD